MLCVDVTDVAAPWPPPRRACHGPPRRHGRCGAIGHRRYPYTPSPHPLPHRPDSPPRRGTLTGPARLSLIVRIEQGPPLSPVCTVRRKQGRPGTMAAYARASSARCTTHAHPSTMPAPALIVMMRIMGAAAGARLGGSGARGAEG